MNKKEIIENIFKKVSKIKYGNKYLDGKDVSDDEYNKNFPVPQDPEYTLKTGFGNCIDTSFLISKLLLDSGLENQIITFLPERKEEPSHTVCITKDDKRFYWIETSFFEEIGIHEDSNLKNLLKRIQKILEERNFKETGKKCAYTAYRVNKNLRAKSGKEYETLISNKEDLLNKKKINNENIKIF